MIEIADYMQKRYEEYILQKGIEMIVEQSKAFEFLNHEEDLYTEDDIVGK